MYFLFVFRAQPTVSSVLLVRAAPRGPKHLVPREPTATPVMALVLPARPDITVHLPTSLLYPAAPGNTRMVPNQRHLVLTALQAQHAPAQRKSNGEVPYLHSLMREQFSFSFRVLILSYLSANTR